MRGRLVCIALALLAVGTHQGAPPQPRAAGSARADRRALRARRRARHLHDVDRVGATTLNGIHGRYFTPALVLLVPLLAGLGGSRLRISRRAASPPSVMVVTDRAGRHRRSCGPRTTTTARPHGRWCRAWSRPCSERSPRTEGPAAPAERSRARRAGRTLPTMASSVPRAGHAALRELRCRPRAVARSRRRPAAPTAGDLARFAVWCEARGFEPAAAEVRDLRRYAASLTQRGLAPTSVARARSPRCARSTACCASAARSRRTRPTC